MKNLKHNSRENIMSFYFIPFSVSFSVRIIVEGEFNHLVYSLIGLQARLFAIIILIISIYIMFNVLYKIPKKTGGISNVKVIWLKLIYSPFLYVFVITIISNLVIRYIFTGYIAIILIIIILIICYILQQDFMDEIEDYI